MNFLLLIIAVIVLSQAGNLIRLCDAHPFVIAFYRLALASLLFVPFAWLHRRHRPGGPIRRIDRKTFLALTGMAVMFAAHLFFWIAGVQHTTVANAAICFSLSPVFTAIGARVFLGERIGIEVLLAIVAGLTGIGLIGAHDLSLSPRFILGDILSLLGGLCFSVYFIIGKPLRAEFSNGFLMSVVYLAGALFSFVIVLASGAPFTGFDAKTYAGFVSLAVFPTIIGHALLVYMMKFFKASTVSTAILLEPAGAGLVSYFAYGENLSINSFIGYALIMAGLIPMFRSKGH